MKYIKLENKLIAFVKGTTIEVDHLHLNYRKIQEAFKHNNEDEILELLDVEERLKNGIYLLFRTIEDQEKPLYIDYVNTNKGQQMFRHVSHIDDIFALAESDRPFIERMPDQYKNTVRHIGTFASIDEILDEYPEYFIWYYHKWK